MSMNDRELNFINQPSTSLPVPETRHDQEKVSTSTPTPDTIASSSSMKEDIGSPETISTDLSPASSRPGSRADSLSSQTSVDESQIPKMLESKSTPPCTKEKRSHLDRDTVAIYYCGDVVSEDLGKRIHAKVQTSSLILDNAFLSPDIRPLNDLETSELTADKVFLLVVSTTSAGEIPANGSGFADMCSELCQTNNLKGVGAFRFSVFSDGDIRCTPSFNVAGQVIYNCLQKIGGIPLVDSPFESNRAVSHPPLSALDKWWGQIQCEMDITPITIYYCGEDSFSEKLAKRLHGKIAASGLVSQRLRLSADIKSLDNLDPLSLTANKVFLLVVSTTEMGRIPPNGKDFADACGELAKEERTEGTSTFKFSVFSDGDSRHTFEFKAAARAIHQRLTKMGGSCLIGGTYESNRTASSPPFPALEAWWAMLRPNIRNLDPNGALTEDEIPPELYELKLKVR